MQAVLITLNSICLVLLIVTVLTGRYKLQWGDTKLVMAALAIVAVSLGGSVLITSLT
nr:hypothetical protein [Kocuria rosea]